MKILKQVPNMLSVLRIILSVVLLFLTGKPWVFLIVYLINGATDVFDGKIARRFDAVSSLGSKLDAVGDSLLFGSAAICMFFLADLKVEPLKCAIVLSFGVVYKLANVAVTRVRFGQWNMMHTTLNKTVFVSLFFCVPIFLLLGEIDFRIVAAVSVIMCVACLEETITLMKLEEYDVNCKGILGEKVAEKVTRHKAA